MDPTEREVIGKVLNTPMLVTDRGRANWDDYTFRKVKHVEPVQLTQDSWTLIYSESDYDRANKVVDNMKQASGSFGIKVQEPEYIEVPAQDAQRRDGSGFVNPINSDLVKKTIIAVVLIDDPKKK
jgi:hypothetical protein